MRLPKLATLGALAALGAFALGAPANAQNTIKVGVPMPLSGPAALYGEPAVKGARMFVEEINAAGGVLGKKIELVVRDSKASADEAVRVSRELILKEEVQFLVGTLTSAEGPAVSTIAKENKIILIAPIPKTDQLTAEKNLHPYVFRTAANTTMEGRSAAEIIATWKDVKKVATIAPRLRLRAGRDESPSSTTSRSCAPTSRSWTSSGRSSARPTTRPSSMRRWPRSPRRCSRPCGAVTSSPGRSRPSRWASSISSRTVSSTAARPARSKPRARSAPTTRSASGATATISPPTQGQPDAHKKYIDTHQGFHQGGSALDLADHHLCRHAVPGRRHQEGRVRSTATRWRRRLLELTIDAPFGKQTLRASDHQADRGQFYGKMIKGPDGNAIMTEVKYVDPRPFM